MNQVKHIKDLLAISALIIVFCCTEIIINPIGNFPLNDDWWYANLFKKLFVDAGTDPVSWGAASLWGQLLLTKAYTFFFGFSYTSLRFLTLLLSFLSVLFFYKLCVAFLNIHEKVAFMLTLLMLFNPLFLCLSNSYMTDIPFLFFCIGAIYFYLHYRKSKSTFYFCMSILFFVFAVLTRQLALVFLFGILFTEIYSTKKLSIPLVIIFLAPLLALLVFEYWLSYRVNNNIYTYVFFRNYSIQNKIPLTDSIINFSKRWVHYITITGFTLFPVLIPYLFHLLFKKKTKLLHAPMIISLILFIPVFISLKNFPIGNYIYNLGVGPDTLYDTYILHINNSQESTLIFGILKSISFLGSFSFLLLSVNSLFNFYKDFPLRRISLGRSFILVFIGLSILLYYTALSFTSAIFDRYIMVFSLFAILLTFRELAGALSGKLFILLLFLLIVFSVLSTKDYLNNNRTKWMAVHFLKQNYKITDKQINAGLEHEGSSFPETDLWYSKWLNMPHNEYLISRGPVKDYSLFSYFTYRRYLPFRRDTLFILKLNELTP